MNAIHSLSPFIGIVCANSIDRKKQISSPHSKCTYLSLPKWHSHPANLSYILKTFFISFLLIGEESVTFPAVSLLRQR